VPTRKRSEFVSIALNEKIIAEKLIERSDPWKELFKLAKSINLNISDEQIIQAKNYGRE
jgi:hypothetical protein